ncbi:MAG: hypothetical protein WCX16_03030 [Candidatus Omnitrophota bacterium]|jgi:hypothetical protein
MKTISLIGVCVFLLVVGCRYTSPISDQVKSDLERPINCATAQADIQTLEAEKVSASQQAKSGIKMVVPAAAARSILHGDYLDSGKVATGEYNAAIDEKISKIRSFCGL